jgi:hypothetical protein
LTFAHKPGGFEAILQDLDVILVEACSDVEIVFREVVVNRLRLVDSIVQPLEALAKATGDKALGTAARQWYYDGLIKASPRRSEYASHLLRHMPRDSEQDELLRAIVREAAPRRISMETLLEGLERIEGLLGKPAGVLTHTQNYMPDGRPLSWPPTFHRDLMETCRKNQIPLMHPCELVEKHGAKVALKADLVHWHDDFMPVVGEAIAEFAMRIADG